MMIEVFAAACTLVCEWQLFGDEMQRIAYRLFLSYECVCPSASEFVYVCVFMNVSVCLCV